MDKIEELLEKLEDSKQKVNSRLITLNRGRLIKELKKQINKLKKENIKDNIELKKLEELLVATLNDHKNQLNGRYKNEFVKDSGSVKSIVTSLPKGLILSVKKIVVCIDSLKQAKGNKERIYGTVNILKAAGLFVATPVIFAGKFIVKHWYLLLILVGYLLNIPGYTFEKLKENIINGGTLIDDVNATLHNKEELHQILENAIIRAKNLPETVSNDYKKANDLYVLVRGKFDVVLDAIKRINLKRPFTEDYEIGKRLNDIVEKIENLDMKSNLIVALSGINDDIDKLMLKMEEYKLDTAPLVK